MGKGGVNTGDKRDGFPRRKCRPAEWDRDPGINHLGVGKASLGNFTRGSADHESFRKVQMQGVRQRVDRLEARAHVISIFQGDIDMPPGVRRQHDVYVIIGA